VTDSEGSFEAARAPASTSTSATASDEPQSVDLFADFEAKAKLFEELAADTSVEVSFAEHEEEEEGGPLLVET
jgi:hypothetical protein